MNRSAIIAILAGRSGFWEEFMDGTEFADYGRYEHEWRGGDAQQHNELMLSSDQPRTPVRQVRGNIV